MVGMSSTATAHVSGSDNTEISGDLTTTTGIEIMDNFASEEEKLVKNEIVKDEIVQKSGKTGLIIGITVSVIFIGIALYFLLKKNNVSQINKISTL
tara:strand:+ start:184 stop:471 length:288 start_codon:yes stop_codon:yes gene_type:complete